MPGGPARAPVRPAAAGKAHARPVAAGGKVTGLPATLLQLVTKYEFQDGKQGFPSN